MVICVSHGERSHRRSGQVCVRKGCAGRFMADANGAGEVKRLAGKWASMDPSGAGRNGPCPAWWQRPADYRESRGSGERAVFWKHVGGSAGTVASEELEQDGFGGEAN